MIDEKMLIKILSKNSIFEKITNAEGKNVFEIIESLPKTSEWIPCSERLPIKAGKYLVTIREGWSNHATVRRFNPSPKHPEQNAPVFTKHLAYYSGWERATRGVIAWQPLPEPYKGEQEWKT